MRPQERVRKMRRHQARHPERGRRPSAVHHEEVESMAAADPFAERGRTVEGVAVSAAVKIAGRMVIDNAVEVDAQVADDAVDAGARAAEAVAAQITHLPAEYALAAEVLGGGGQAWASDGKWPTALASWRGHLAIVERLLVEAMAATGTSSLMYKALTLVRQMIDGEPHPAATQPLDELYDDDQCPGACDFDAQAAYEPHTVAQCGGPWKRQGDLRTGPRPKTEEV